MSSVVVSSVVVVSLAAVVSSSSSPPHAASVSGIVSTTAIRTKDLLITVSLLEDLGIDPLPVDTDKRTRGIGPGNPAAAAVRKT